MRCYPDAFHTCHFFVRSFLNTDLLPAVHTGVKGRRRTRYIEWDVVVLSNNGQLIRPDLVGCIAIGNDPVGTHDNRGDAVLVHQDGRLAVADQSGWNVVVDEFIRCESCPLVVGAGFCTVRVSNLVSLVKSSDHT